MAGKNGFSVAFFYPHPLCEVLGGTERVTCTLADALERRGHKVFFVAYEESCGRRVCENADYARQHFIPRREIRKAFPHFVREHEIACVVYQDGAVPLPFSRLRGLGCRLVVALHYPPDFYTEDYWKIFLEKRLPRPLKPLAGFFIKTPLNALGLALLRRRIGRVYSASLAECDAFVLLSKRFFPRFRELLGEKSFEAFRKKIHAIPNPSVLAAVPAGTRKKRELLYVGRLENNQKRVDLLLRIWSCLEAEFPEWRLRIVGSGPDAEGLRTLAGTLGLTRASFEGFRDPVPYYRNAAIFCMTSRYEGFGLVLTEAMSAGCVPVAFLSEKTAVFEDIVADGESGVLVPEGDCEGYARALASLMRDAALRERLSVAARERAAAFAPEKIAERWEEFFPKRTFE